MWWTFGNSAGGHEMRIAIIGSGISGLTSAYLLNQDHEVVVYEANNYIGGHTNTVDGSLNGSLSKAGQGRILSQ